MVAGTGRRTDRQRFIRLAALSGMAAPVLFVATFTVEGWLRPGYNAAGMFVSDLSLGPRGWVQIANFLVTGSLVLLFARGVAARFPSGIASRAGPLLLRVIGLSLIASGPFVTDPSAMFNQHSVHGLAHGICGALVFALAPVSCFVFFRRFRHTPSGQPFAWWALLVGVVTLVGVGVLKGSQFPQSDLFAWKGVIQRIILVTYMAWLFTLAARIVTHAD